MTPDEVLAAVDFERELVFGDNEAQVLVLAREVLRLRAELARLNADRPAPATRTDGPHAYVHPTGSASPYHCGSCGQGWNAGVHRRRA